MLHKNGVRPVVAVVGIDIGKNNFHVVAHDKSGAIVLRQKWSRGQVESRLAKMPPCLSAWGAVSALITSLASSSPSADARLMPATYVRP
jgi:transposase